MSLCVVSQDGYICDEHGNCKLEGECDENRPCPLANGTCSAAEVRNRDIYII